VYVMRKAKVPDQGRGTVTLRYVGNGRYIPGVPADTIDVPESMADRLIASGLYEPLIVPAPEPEHSEGEMTDGE
jgi:hypothetical protein